MALQLWDNQRLYRMMEDDRFNAIPNHFLDTYFGDTYFSDDKVIRLAKLPTMDRRMAPFVRPTVQGRPIFREKPSTVTEFLPAYMKPKDAVRATDAANPRISELTAAGPLSTQQRFNLRVLELSEYHMRAIRMTEAWMAARAFIDGEVTINYHVDQGEPHPEVTVDFDRDSGHTVVLDSAYWSSISTKILDNVETWANTMQEAAFGGYPARLYLGSSVVPHFKANTQVIGELDTDRRGTAVDIPTGIIRGVGIVNPVQYIGQLSSNIEVYAYRDKVEYGNGTWVDLLDPKDILLVAPGASGVRAYGAIYNAEAMDGGGNVSTDIYPSMWYDKDPSVAYLMHESAPLPIPLYPNRTFKATVLA